MNKSDCNHSEISPHRDSRILVGHKFEYNTQKCLNCHAVLWSQNNENDYNKWLESLDKSLFSLSGHISKTALKWYEEISLHGPNIEDLFSEAIESALNSRIGAIQTIDGYTEKIVFTVSPKVYVRFHAKRKIANTVEEWLVGHMLEFYFLKNVYK